MNKEFKNNWVFNIYDPYPSRYANNIQARRGKANIHWKLDEKNEYDPEAIEIYTLTKDGSKEPLGYLQKRRFIERIFTDEFHKTYLDWFNEMADWIYEPYLPKGEEPIGYEEWMDKVPGIDWYWRNIADSNKSYVKETIYKPIYKDGEIEQLLEVIDTGKMRFRYFYDDDSRVLFHVDYWDKEEDWIWK